MSSIPLIHQFPCQIIQKSSQDSKSIASNAFYCSNGIQFSAISIKKSIKVKRNFAVQAAEEDDWDRGPVSGVTVVEAEPPTEIKNLKKQLVDSVYGTNRGLCASSETRAVIAELISQLEVNNPTPAPTKALTLLNGKWILV